MSVNWASYTGFSIAATCLPCCETATGCYLDMPTLLVDGTTSPYANSGDATAAIAAQAATGCLGEWGGAAYPRTAGSLTTSFSAGVFLASVTTTTAQVGPPIFSSGSAEILMRVYATAADGLDIVYNFGTTGPGTLDTGSLSILIYDDDQSTLLFSDGWSGSSSLSGTYSPAITTDQHFWIKVQGTGIWLGVADTGVTIDLSTTGGSSLLPCSVRAAYGGTPDYVICT